MSNLTEIDFAFKIASDSFDPTRLKPNDNGLQHLNGVLVVPSLSVPFTRTNPGTANDVVLSDAVYKSNNGVRAFDFIHTSREDYDPSISRLGK